MDRLGGHRQGLLGYRYGLNVNGAPIEYGERPEDFVTDVLARRARDLVAERAADRRPFFLLVSSFAPHTPAAAAPRHLASAAGLRAPRNRAFDRANHRAPGWLRQREALSGRQQRHIDDLYRRRVASMRSVDGLVRKLRADLRAYGLADKTYFVFSSDNGFHMGEHRLTPGKKTAFDSDIRVPLVIAGPGIRAGRTVRALAQNTDLAPTFNAIAGAGPLPGTDGRSLLPLLRGAAPRDWRTAALVEHRKVEGRPDDPDRQPRSSGSPPSYAALRLPHATYVEYDTGEREYYDLRRDPTQRVSRYAQLPPHRKRRLHTRLEALRRCAGPRDCATDRSP